MPITRREFIAGAGITLAAGSLATQHESNAAETQPSPASATEWSAIRAQFDLTHDYIHLAPFYLVSHPRPVREAIEKYRRAIDANPLLAIESGVFGTQTMESPLSGTHRDTQDRAYELPNLTEMVREAAAQYIGAKAEEIALTDSTTMGLGLAYNGLMLKPGDEILTTTHDFFSHHESIRLATERTGASMRKFALFDNFETISEDQIVSRVRNNIRPVTRTLGITWVHSSSGVKLPVRAIAATLDDINSKRDERERILLIVDGVHGFGIEDINAAELGCDVFIAGTHKWIFGPRGTGIVWARKEAWAKMRPTIPSFVADELWNAWRENRRPIGMTTATWMTSGGFKAYEYQWAMADAFRFIGEIGRKRIAERTYELNDQCKEGLAKISGVKLYTPRDRRQSAGIVCFDIDGMQPDEVVQRLLARKILMTATPYAPSFARVAPSIIASPEEIDRFLREVRTLVPT